jgi:hypothetical protein
MLVRPSRDYYLQLANRVILLAPASVLSLPPAWCRRIVPDPPNVHQLIGSVFVALLVLMWRAYPGIDNDAGFWSVGNHNA